MSGDVGGAGPVGQRKDKLRLGAFFHPTGNHVASWLSTQARRSTPVANHRHYVGFAQTAECGKFNLMSLANAVATRAGGPNAMRR